MAPHHVHEGSALDQYFSSQAEIRHTYTRLTDPQAPTSPAAGRPAQVSRPATASQGLLTALLRGEPRPSAVSSSSRRGTGLLLWTPAVHAIFAGHERVWSAERPARLVFPAPEWALLDPERSSSAALLAAEHEMLNVKALSEMLKANEDDRLWPKIFLISPNGALIAYSSPSNIKVLRDQAALISMAWREHQDASRRQEAARLDTASSTSSPHAGAATANTTTTAFRPLPAPTLHTLTIEQNDVNIIVRQIQPQLLLVLRGRAPPARKLAFRATPEARGSRRYPSGDAVISLPAPPHSADASSAPSDASEASASPSAEEDAEQEEDLRGGALHLQRKKLEAVAAGVLRDFGALGFVMPDDAAVQRAQGAEQGTRYMYAP